jgi:hypothetical protein
MANNRDRNLVIGRRAVLLAAVLTLAATAIAQQTPGPINAPALPSTPPPGSFGPSLFNSSGLSFPNPNHTTWTALGPAPLTENGGGASGRIAGVAVDPTNSNNIYIAAAGGGVWQTTNGGTTWTPLTDTQGTLAMGSIAIAPTNHLHIYAGTGEANNSADSNYGLGILLSTDGGATWSISAGPSNVFNRLAIGKISVDPTNDNIAYASVNDFDENGPCFTGPACAGTGIYKTSDGGMSWTNVTSANGKDSLYPWSDVVVDPNTHTTIYAAHGDPFAYNTANGVYRSTDSGSTWTLLTGAPNGGGIGRIALAVAPSATTSGAHVLYAAVATNYTTGSVLFEMLVSNNADAATPTFNNLSATPNFGGSGGQAWYDWVIAVSPVSASNVYAAGALNYNNNTDHVITSVNGGTSWIDITTVGGIEPHTDSHGMAFDSSNRLLLGNDGGIWRYDPTGAGSWTNLNGNLNTIQFTGIGLHPTNNQIVIGGSQDNGTELTIGSANWTSTDGGDGGFSQISQTGGGGVVYSNHPIGSFGPTAFFRVSTDGGNTWTSRTPSISNEGLFNFYSPIFVDPSNGSRVFLGGDALYESTNAGLNWTTHTSPVLNPIDAIAVLGNFIYIATGGTFATTSQIWFSSNDGTSWTQRSLPVGGRVNELDLDYSEMGNAVVAVINTFNGANGQIYATANNGTTWFNITGNAPAIPTWSAKIGTDANTTIYVSNETGVYSSPSPYGTWAAVGTGLPHAQGVHLELNSSLNELGLATHGRGAWNFATVAPVITLTAVSVTPNSGSGVGPTTFNALYTDSAGATDLQVVYLNFGSVDFAAHDCVAAYVPSGNQLYLYNDTVSGALGPITLGAGGSLSNSQCTLNGGSTAATISGDNLTVPFNVTFKTGYGGLKQMFILAQSMNGTQSGGGVPNDAGTWTPAATTPGVVSVTPNSGSGTSQVFTATFSDSGGANDLQAVYLDFASVYFAAHNCEVVYTPGLNQLYLFNDGNNGALGPISLGAGGGTLSNSQCTLSSGTTAATLSGDTLTVPFTITFKAGYGGLKTIFALSQTYAGVQSGSGVPGTMGSWTPAASSPAVVSVSPINGSGAGPQVFTAVYSDSGGGNDLQGVYLTFGPVLNAGSSCAAIYEPGLNVLYLFNDAGTGVLGPISEGAGGGTLSNSQCTLTSGTTAATLTGAGNPTTLNVPFNITFKNTFTTIQKVWGFAQTYAGAQSNGGAATNLGSWTP